MIDLKHGDCLEILNTIPDKSVALILCDPPYGTTDCKWDSVLPFEPLWAEYNRILKPNGAAVLFAAQPFTTQLIMSNKKDFRYCWYWFKNQPTGFTFARYQPMRKVEDICVFYRKMPTYNPQGLVEIKDPKPQKKTPRTDSAYKIAASHKEFTPRFTNWPKNVLQFNSERGLHPTQKPVPLLEYLVKTYTNPRRHSSGQLHGERVDGSGLRENRAQVYRHRARPEILRHRAEAHKRRKTKWTERNKLKP